MATGTTGIPSPAAPLVSKSDSASKNTATNDRENYILRQIQATRNQVKNLELAQSFLLLIVGVLAFFLTIAILDHWVVSGGLSKWQRGTCFVALLGGVGWYLWKKFLPLFMMRINPFYAAKTLEQSAPTMKNGLINYLWFRQSRAEMPETIYNVIQEQTARGLTSVQIDQAVDRTPLIRILYVLLGCIFTFSLYFLVSPKNPFTTISRVVSPWSDVQSPSRVQITGIEPGHTKLYRGQSLTIKCEVANLREGEHVVLHYTTQDGQLRDVNVPMRLPPKGYRYECSLPVQTENSSNANLDTSSPAGIASGGASESKNKTNQQHVANNSAATVNPVVIDPMSNPMLGGIPVLTDAELQRKLGLQQSFEYWITAGDARTANFRVQVESAPYIAVERIDFDYPAYTKMARETRNDPDINVIEGTRVTIHALANQPMKSGRVEFFTKTGRVSESMKINGVSGTKTFTLSFKDDQQADQEYTGYQLKFTNNEKRENPEPIRHSIRIITDIPPSVEIIEPTSADKVLAPNQPFHVNVTATDPDYGLTHVRLVGEFQGEPLFTQNLLVASAENPHVGKFQRSADLSLDQLGLKPGMSIEYWAEATDVKSPQPNVVQTNKRRLTILNPDAEREQQVRDRQQPNPQAGNPQQNFGEIGQNDPNNQLANNDQNHDNQNPDQKNAARNNQNNQVQHPKNPDGQKGNNPETRGENPRENNSEARDPTKNEVGKQGGNNRRQNDPLNQQQGSDQNPDRASDPQENRENAPAQENKIGQNNPTQNRRSDNQSNRDKSEQENRNEAKKGANDEPGKLSPMNDQQDSQTQGAQNRGNQQSSDPADITDSKSGNETKVGNNSKSGDDDQNSNSTQDDPSDANRDVSRQQSKNGERSQSNKSAGRPTEEKRKTNSDGSQDDKAIQKFLEDIEKKFDKKPDQKNSDGSDPNNKDLKNPSDQQLAQNDQGKQNDKDNSEKSGQGSKQSDTMKGESGKTEAGKSAQGKSEEPANSAQGNKSEPGAQSNPGKKSDPSKQPTQDQVTDAREQQNNASQQPNQKSDPKGQGGQPEQQKQGQGQQSRDGKTAGGQKGPAEQGKQNEQSQPGEGQEGQQQAQQGTGQEGQGNPMNQSGQPQTGQHREEARDQMGNTSQQKNSPQSGQGKEQNQLGQGQKTNPSQQNQNQSTENGNPQGESQKQDGAGAKGSSNQEAQSKSEASAKSGSPSVQQNRSTAEEKGKPAQASEGSRQRTDSNPTQSDPRNPQSNSQPQGESDQDRVEGGKKGQGNPSKAEGKGAAGSSTPDDSGANMTNQTGQGETGSEAGEQAKSDRKSGRAGNEAGKGSSSRTTQQQTGRTSDQGSAQQGSQSETGEQSAQNSASSQPGKGSARGKGQPNGESSQQQSNQNQSPGQQPGNGSEGNVAGNGGSGRNNPTDAAPTQGSLANAAEEKVNEEYSRKATDLVLEHLQRQIRDGKVDQDALNQLGWTEAELKQFVARWQQLRAEAMKPGPEGELAAKKLSDRLKSLGLRPTQTTRANSTTGDDNERGNNQSRRIPPPAEFRQMFNDFKKATSGK